jgi:predicted methyltransferase
MNRLTLVRLAALTALLPATLGATSGCGAERASAAPVAIVQNTGVEVPSGAPAVPARVNAVLAQPDRTAADRALDGPRQAAQVLAYLDVAPGSSVAVLAPGSGYTMELIARSVGPGGMVFARNPPFLLAASGLTEAWDARLAQPAGARVIRIDAELGKQLDAQALDLVFLDHDYAELRTHAVVPSAVVAGAWYALRSGGRFVVMEREAEAAETRGEIEGHGFRFESEGRFLRDGTDPSDWNRPRSADMAQTQTSEARQARGAEKSLFLMFLKP